MEIVVVSVGITLSRFSKIVTVGGHSYDFNKRY